MAGATSAIGGDLPRLVYAVGDCIAVETLPKAGVFSEAMGVVPAKNIMADITGKVSSRYGGAGYCFLEFPDHRASALEGNFFAEPADVAMADPTAESYTRKQNVESDRLRN